MVLSKFKNCLYENPVITAVREERLEAALNSDAAVVFLLEANLLSVENCIKKAHQKGKIIFVHIDLAIGLGRDKTAVIYLKNLSADGIVSTKVPLIRAAKELGLLTVQRFFALDSKGLNDARDMIDSAHPDMVEVMPGTLPKVIKKFSTFKTPVIAGGLIETKQEVTEALSNGAIAVSTGKEELWNI